MFYHEYKLLIKVSKELNKFIIIDETKKLDVVTVSYAEKLIIKKKQISIKIMFLYYYYV